MNYRLFLIFLLLNIFLVLPGCQKLEQSDKQTKQLGESKNSTIESGTVLTPYEAIELAKEKHDIAEDLFNPTSNVDYKYVTVSAVPREKKFKLTDFKSRDPHEFVNLSNSNESKSIVVKNDEFMVSDVAEGLYCLGNYDHVVNMNLSQKMKTLLAECRHIFEYSDGEIYVFKKSSGILNGYISSEFIPTEIKANRIEYIVRSTYFRDSHICDKPEKSPIICDKKFVLIKESDTWKVDEFSTSKYYVPIRASYRHGVYTREELAEAEQFANDIINIFVNKDINALSEIIDYPIDINGRNIKNKYDFCKLDTNEIFEPELVKNITSAKELFYNWKGFMIANGPNIWFNFIVDSNYDLKIVSITTRLELEQLFP